jgi:hypothetical protein
MQQGWIKLHRQIMDNPLYKQKRKFSKFEAWIDILLSVNHKEGKVLIDYSVETVKRGEFITSEVKLANKWNWDRKTVRKFLTLLQQEEMILKSSTKRWTSITVINWDKYQLDGQEVGQGVGQGVGQDRDRGLDTNKNDKNDKNDKKNNISSKVFADDAQELLLAQKLKTLILSNNPKARVPDNLQKWAYEIDKMIRLDKRTPKEIESVIEFSQNDSFWMANILSVAALRKQFDKLYLQSKRQRNMKPNQPVKTFWDNDYTGKGQAQEEETYNPEIDNIIEKTLEKMSKPKKGR